MSDIIHAIGHAAVIWLCFGICACIGWAAHALLHRCDTRPLLGEGED